MGAGWLSQAMERLIPIHERGTLFPSLPVIPAAARNGVVFKHEITTGYLFAQQGARATNGMGRSHLGGAT